MANDYIIYYNPHEADNFVANNRNEVINRGDYYKRPCNIEMLGRIMPEFAKVLAEAYNRTPDVLARLVLRCGYCCDQIARGDITPYEAWRLAYNSARCLHQLATDILSDGFSYDASTDSVVATSPSGKYNRASYGFIAHMFKAMCDERWLDVLYENYRKEYDGERCERLARESCMRWTHTHYAKSPFLAFK